MLRRAAKPSRRGQQLSSNVRRRKKPPSLALAARKEHPTVAPTIRPFAHTDYPSARRLWEATPGVGLSDADEPEAINRFLNRNPGLSFVAVEGESLLGTILCGHDGRRGLIHHLATAQSARRRGVGRLLLRAGTRALREAGISKCHLLVFRANADGLAFWRAVQASERSELMLFSLATGESAA